MRKFKEILGKIIQVCIRYLEKEKKRDLKCRNKPPFVESSGLLAEGNPFKTRLLQGELQQKRFCLI